MRRIILVLAALLAFAGHGFVTQTHVHFPLGTAQASLADSGGQRLATRESPGKAPATCPICREYVNAGHYLPPAPIVFDPASEMAVWVFVPVFVVWHGRQRSHAWLSRGPPRGRIA